MQDRILSCYLSSCSRGKDKLSPAVYIAFSSKSSFHLIWIACVERLHNSQSRLTAMGDAVDFHRAECGAAVLDLTAEE
jgi:hypothetical protein